MNRRRFIKLVSLTSVMTALAPRQAYSITVFDPSNFAQNILQAIRVLQSNINEARMIANQVISLANDAKNLASLPYDMISEFNTQFSGLFSTVGSINGMMQNLGSLQSRFEELFPNFLMHFDPISRASMAEDVKKQIENTREVMLGAAKTGAQVLENLPQTQAQLDKLMSDSQGAVGMLQATQAGNQIAGTISGNLIQLNAQLATYMQAHTNFLMEQSSASAAARNRFDHVLEGWNTPSGGKAIPENPF